ncbi:hypothetical protein KY290_024882 [Solanum tuberosum]|uniref:Ulp1 protease family, C-terminal catalytic domain containing protein n=1 Tax=Solanum tuberosum TaxID=4113 RepID=A0ABQ7UTY6_SOLTU|nr:hypothetical protein KY284_023735 [Solanum tuberosum]KAH0754612.1 hypothetical protein KY290_024882 [Solanum tuberosum]
MGILYFINSFVLSQLPNAPIHGNEFLMVEDGGMPYALNVWVYECASVVNEEIVVKEGDYIPRILNWRVVGVKAKIEMFVASIFTENACTNIQPTCEELIVLDLSDNLVVSHSEHSLSADKPTQDISDEIPGFEDFSSKPPDQIVRRSNVYLVHHLHPPREERKLFQSNPTVLMKAVRKLKRKKIARTSLPISEEEVIEEDNAGEETHVQQHEVVEDDDTLKDKRVNDGVSEPPSTVNVPVAGNVSNKVFFANTSKDSQAAEDVSNEIDQRAGENVSKEVMDDVVEFGTNKTEQPTVVQDVADKSQLNIPIPDKVSVNINTSDSTTSTSISAGTQEAIDVLIASLQTPLCVQPLSVVK